MLTLAARFWRSWPGFLLKNVEAGQRPGSLPGG
jgi:hypothetical protein